MKLETVKKTDFEGRIPNGNSVPFLSLNGKNGVIAINKAALEHFKLSEGDSIGFLKDAEEEPPAWYIRTDAVDVNCSFKLSKGSGRLQFSNKALARNIILDIQKKFHPHLKPEELNLEVFVRFRIATAAAVDDSGKEIPDCYALLGGHVVETNSK